MGINLFQETLKRTLNITCPNPKFTLFHVVAFQPVKSIIHALGHNRARQRDKLAHLLEEFAALQDEVSYCDFGCFESRLDHNLLIPRKKTSTEVIWTHLGCLKPKLMSLITSRLLLNSFPSIKAKHALLVPD